MTHLKDLMHEFHTLLHELVVVLDAPHEGDCELVTPSRQAACDARRELLRQQAKALGVTDLERK